MNNEFVEYYEMFPAGTYYIGDFCYILKERDYEDIVCSFEYDEQPYKYKKFLFCFNNTAYGDGLYEDQYGNKYAVDSGTIGIINIATKVMLKEANKLVKDKLANVVTFDEPFYVSCCGGVFEFGNIKIDTNEDY
ncbi:hypothetical protein BNCALIDO_00187 [Aeromonas phage vB_AdhM_TS9]|nr:hypothetical protein BNCALIDO_00187 [Aeromonas phage vB_AdhM_TS9]